MLHSAVCLSFDCC